MNAPHCSIAECGGLVKARSLCNKHYELFRRNGNPLARQRRERGTGSFSRSTRRLTVRQSGRNIFAHVVIAETALGRKLPDGACVHHADGDPSNNAPSNLVICPNQAYHSLLHQRMRAQQACGNPDWRKCKYCGQYDAPDRLKFYKSDVMHRECNNARMRKLKASKRQSA